MLDKIAGMPGWQIEILATALLLQGVAFAAIPEEIILLSLGVLWGEGRVGFLDSLAAALAGLLPANAIMVFIGNKLGRRLLVMPPFSWIVKARHLEKALEHLHKHGVLTILVTRFTPLIRGPVYLAVGVSRIPLVNFLKIDASASLFHAPLLLLLGRFMSRNVPVEIVYRGIVIAAGVTLGVSVLVILFDILRRPSTLVR